MGLFKENFRSKKMKIIVIGTYVCAECEKKISDYWYKKHKHLDTVLCKECMKLNSIKLKGGKTRE